MELEKRKAAIEAVLFTMGDKVRVADLSACLEESEEATLEAINSLIEDYNDDKRGIRLVKLEDAYQLCTKNEYYEVLAKLVNQPKKYVLTDVLLETLSIIAYKQPITRVEIENIRGVSCVHAVNRLVEYGLVEEVGRLDAIGHPILFGTTDAFLRSFGVESKDDLPIITADKIAAFEAEAIKEAEEELSEGGEKFESYDDDVIAAGEAYINENEDEDGE